MKTIEIFMIIVLVYFTSAKTSILKDVDSKEIINLIKELKDSVRILQNATVNKQQKKTGHFVYFWDLMNPVVKFLLLNQTEILSLPFDISERVIRNKSRLNWSKLPDDVQELLVNQQGSAYLFLTFEQWGWVNENSTLSGATLYSILPLRAQTILPHFLFSVAPLQFDMKIDYKKLNKLIKNKMKNVNDSERDRLAEIFIDSLFQNIGDIFELMLRSSIKSFIQQPTVIVVLDAIIRAQQFLKSNND